MERLGEFVQRATGHWNPLTVALIAFLLALAVHHLMILGTLRRLRREASAQRLIKREYATIPPVYDFLSFFFVLAGVLLILLLWFRSQFLVPLVGMMGVLFLALLCFILSGYLYLVGIARAAIQVIQDLVRKSRP
ncbi:MAG: hypothetical protein HY587_06660 [Candidatus Omnitrophica bacterium]|nr:hypothetical protein [Candidatus Omnitrophota bacterium]